MGKEIILPIEEIIEKYKNGIRQSEIAKEYGVGQTTISIKMKKYYESLGIKVAKSENKGPKRKELPIEEIIKQYEAGIRVNELVKEYNLSKSTIVKAIGKYYEETGKDRIKHKGGPKRKELPMEEIIKKYEVGVGIKDIVKEYNVSDPIIRVRIQEYYLENNKAETNKKTTGTKRKELPIEEIIKQYETGVSTTTIAKEYNVSGFTITTRIKEYYEKTGRERIKHKRKKRELPINEIIKQYEAGIEISVMIKEYNVSKTNIRKRIAEYYKETGKERIKHNSGLKRIELPMNEIINKYETGTRVSELVNEYNLAKSTMIKRIREYYKENKNVKRLENEAVIVEFLKKGLTIQEILETALKKNVIIPEEIISLALDKVNYKNRINEGEERENY